MRRWICNMGMVTTAALAALASDGGLAISESFSANRDVIPSAAFPSGVKRGKLAKQMQQDYFLLDAPAELIDTYGVQARQILEQSAPHLKEVCTPVLQQTQTFGSTTAIHEYYSLECDGLKVAQAFISLHLRDHKLVMANWQLPQASAPAPEELVSLPLPELLLGFDYTVHSYEPVLFDDQASELIHAFSVQLESHSEREVFAAIVEAHTGQVFDLQRQQFNASTMYQQNPKHGAVVTTGVPDLKSTGYLDGKNFSVYNPSPADPRIQAVGGKFGVNPFDSDPAEFDQVQVYYGATKALQWFEDKFGYDRAGAQIDIRINDYPGGRPDNAEYKPVAGRPQILIGAGNGVISGLARDNDVVTHEFSHHIIYQRLKSARGESGVLHEGYADYFTYAMYNNPYLAESTMPDRDYLRTAKVSENLRIDDPELPLTSHYRGQIWSALLWQLRSTIGESFDQVVYQSLFYLDFDSGYRDAIYGLLNADLAQQTGLAESEDSLSPHYCQIVEQSIRRGFATYIEDVDGSPCGLDLLAAAQESRSYSSDKSDGSGQKIGFELFGRKCSVIATGTTSWRGSVLVMMVLLLPLAVALGGRRRRRLPCS